MGLWFRATWKLKYTGGALESQQSRITTAAKPSESRRLEISELFFSWKREAIASERRDGSLTVSIIWGGLSVARQGERSRCRLACHSAERSQLK
jgi:hypothetical protein